MCICIYMYIYIYIYIYKPESPGSCLLLQDMKVHVPRVRTRGRPLAPTQQALDCKMH